MRIDPIKPETEKQQRIGFAVFIGVLIMLLGLMLYIYSGLL